MTRTIPIPTATDDDRSRDDPRSAPCWHPAELRRISAYWERPELRVSLRQYRVLMALLMRTGLDRRSTSVGVRCLADDMTTSTWTVQTTIDELVELGLIRLAGTPPAPSRPSPAARRGKS
jgi:hypothetical protein